MKEKDLPIDRTKHKAYSKSAKKCVQKLLNRYYDEKAAAELWEKAQLQYCEYLKDEPALKDLKITTSIYDPILIFAWYAVIPEKPPLEEVQQDIYQSFFGSFELMGKVFDLNRKIDNKLAMQAIHAALIREGTCVTSDCCDYCIVGDKHPMATEYELKQADNGLWISEKTRHPKET